MKKLILVLITVNFLSAIVQTAYAQKKGGSSDSLQYAGEKHFRNLRQLTFGRDNAEAYFSFDGKYLVFQKTNIKEGIPCDQIWMGKIPVNENESFNPKLVSTGTGRTTCAYFYPDGKHILYASTHLASKECPAVPDKVKRYIWPLYTGFDIFKADTNGHIVRRLTKTKGYDAEATISPKGDKIIFTSVRNGDLDLYTMDMKGRH